VPHTSAISPTVAPLGTFSIRRAFKNMTGVPLTALRFRIVDVTTLNRRTPGEADLRVLSSVAATVTRVDGTPVALSALTLEEPPTQTLGGGVNASLVVGTITTGAPLAPGTAVNVEFKLGVVQGGTFRFFVNVEALPGASAAAGAKSAPGKRGALWLN